MRRLLKMGLTPFVFGIALMMPLSASAYSIGGTTYEVDKFRCTNYPGVVFKVTVTDDGTNDVTRLAIDSKGQSGGPGSWSTQTNWARKSASFPDDGTTHQLSLQRIYNGDAFSSNRVVIKVKAWEGPKLVWSRKVVSGSC